MQITSVDYKHRNIPNGRCVALACLDLPAACSTAQHTASAETYRYRIVPYDRRHGQVDKTSSDQFCVRWTYLEESAERKAANDCRRVALTTAVACNTVMRTKWKGTNHFKLNSSVSTDHHRHRLCHRHRRHAACHRPGETSCSRRHSRIREMQP